MIIVEAKLLHGSTYLAGEEVVCQLFFTNPSTPENSLRLSSDIETLAWSTAQIHCQCTLSNTSTVQSDLSQGQDGFNMGVAPELTSFHPTRGERGITVMMTHPKILFCNIKLSPGEKAEYVYREKIPLANIPPTFRGGFVKYSYKLTIGTQRPDSAVSEIKIPFRVLTVDGMKEPSAYTDKQKVLAPSNPFLASDDNSSAEHSVRDIALQLLAEQSARKRNNCYNISNLHGKVARISLPKTSYKIGEDLSCTFDFSQATVQCLQVTVTLQSVEEVSERLKKEGERHTNTISHSNHQEFCLHMSRANIMLPIPLHITPSFNSDFVSLKWQLHIEFVTLTTHIPDQAPAESDTASTLWHGVTDLDTETIHWHLPLTLLSTNPLQCGIIQSVKCDDLVQLD